jgi:Ca-activated chloride channel family protein
MKKLVIPALILVTLVLGACGQSAGQLNNAGNEAFENQEYDDALAAYTRAGQESPELAEPHYNAANTHYRLEDYEQALAQIEAALVAEESAVGLAQHSFFNLGNTFFQGQQFESAIEAFKEALRLNPNDLEAKQNLELALRQMQEQEQQDQQCENPEQPDEQQEQEQDEKQQDQQQDQQQDEQQQNEEQQDQQQDQQQDEQQNEPSQDEQKDQQDGQQDEQDQQQDPQNGEGQPQGEQQDAQPEGQPQQMEGLTEEQARQLFEAAAQDTESLEEFLQQIYVSPAAPPSRDW